MDTLKRLASVLGIAAATAAVPQTPILAVQVGDVQIGIMPDGHVATFSNGKLGPCECDGEEVTALPEGATLLAGMDAANRKVSVYGAENQFYTVDNKGTVRLLKQAHDCAPFHTDWPDMPTPVVDDGCQEDVLVLDPDDHCF